MRLLKPRILEEQNAYRLIKIIQLLLKVQEIRQFCKEQLHDWKCPKQFLLVKELPRNTMGKVLKEEVKKLFA